MQEAVTYERIAATLSQEGSLWLESAFCKEPNGGALLFSNPAEVVTLSSPSGLEPFFRTLEKKLAEGYFLAGWLSYEAGYGFEDRLMHPHPPAGNTHPASPLGWFGVYREPERFSAAQVEQLFAEENALFPLDPAHVSTLSFNHSEAEYAAKIKLIKEHIAAGNLYQVNFTGRYRFTFTGTPTTLFAALRGTQPSSYTAFLNTGGRIIHSFSPELFFRRKGSLIETMPMKGTAARGRTPEEDTRLKEELARCPKNLAENLMIVDLLRNDLGRICKPGSVEAGELFATQTWPTLHQLVSTIRGEQSEHIRLYDLFRALYPCGSITGAPKINAMKLIQTLEPEPRGIYTGTIGYVTPDRDMVFSVAIRTIQLSGTQGVYGSGGGIVWDSDPQEEYRECQLKTKILSLPEAGVSDAQPEKPCPEFELKTTTLHPDLISTIPDSGSREELLPGDPFSGTHKNFELFESILWSGNYLWLQEHLQRLAASSKTLNFPCDTAAAHRMLSQLHQQLLQAATLTTTPQHRFKVKLSLSFQGTLSVSYEPVPVPLHGRTLRLCLAAHQTDSSNPLLSHKTTARELYDPYFTLARQKNFDEVLFLNERDELTEGAISNLIIRKGQELITPPLHSGLLNGIYRTYLIATRPFITEKTITLTDLHTADTIFIANSVRGLRPAQFTGDRLSLP